MYYSILDIETTGVSKRFDRILEIAIIKIDSYGNIIEQFESLINPVRDIGASDIHGLNATMLLKAPTFKDVSHSILKILNQSSIIAHNVNFDIGFLNEEFKRNNINCPEFEGICTLQMSQALFPELPSRKLEVICEYLDIVLDGSHQAQCDCYATMKLFKIMKKLYIDQFGENKFQNTIIRGKYFEFEYESSQIGTQFKRADAIEFIKEEESKISQLLRRIPDYNDYQNYNISEYLNLVDRVLEDRIITDQELQELEDFSRSNQIASSTLEKIHEEYFRRLVRFYLSDNILTDSELIDIEKVGNLLQIQTATRQLIIELEKSMISMEYSTLKTALPNKYEGKTVCFTGTLLCKINGIPISREMANGLAIEKGLYVKNGVTKELDILVVSDPYTQSGKAQKARQYGTKIVAENVFWNELKIKVE